MSIEANVSIPESVATVRKAETVENLKSMYVVGSIISDPSFGTEVSLRPCIGINGDICPNLGNRVTPCRKGNGLIDVGIGVVYCPDAKRGGPLKVIRLKEV